MSSYTVKANQNLFDIALSLYGSVEGIYDLLISNSNLSMDSDLKSGDVLEYHDYFVINDSIAKEISSEGIVPANGERNVYYKSISQPIVMLYKIVAASETVSIQVSGSGTMLFDWGDNSNIESIALSEEVQTITHYFNSKVDERRIKVYGSFSLTYLNNSDMTGNMLLMAPLTVNEFVSQANGFSLSSLLLFEGTEKIDLQKGTISDLTSIYDMSLTELNMLDVKFTSINVIDEYLEYIVSNYGTRQACTVYLNTEPSEAGMEAINTIINNSEWNASAKWKFVINGTTYTKE